MLVLSSETTRLNGIDVSDGATSDLLVRDVEKKCIAVSSGLTGDFY